MYESLMEVLLNGGPMALFAAYLVWSKNKQDEKLESLQEKWLGSLNEFEHKAASARESSELRFQEREDKMRERWLDVVQKVEAERDEVQKMLDADMKLLYESNAELKEHVEKIGNNVMAGLQEMRDHYKEIQLEKRLKAERSR
jgi:hypothetical protein